jgi:hypothetical protein
MKYTFYNNWKKSLNKRNFLIKIYFTIPILVIGLIYLTKFLTFIEFRPGMVLPDPLLDSFKSVDLTWFIFAFTYGSILLGILTIVSKPKLVLTVLHAYMLVLLFRVICLYFTPLEPPTGIIPLHDIMIEDSFYSGRMNLKDLFFSGHTAAIMLFVFAAEKKKIKILMLILTSVVVFGLLMQHVHYTIDIIAAPLFAWASFKLAKQIN